MVSRFGKWGLRMSFGGKQVGEAFGGEFTAYEALPTNTPEAPGDVAYSGPSLNYIKVANGKIYHHAPLDEKVMRLIESSWKHAQPKEGAMRGNIAAGSHRTMHPSAMNSPSGPTMPNAPKMPPLPLRPGQQAPMPMVQTFRSAPAIGFAERLPMPEQKLKGAHLLNISPEDWSLMKTLPRVTAYTFRGDRRNPSEIKAVNGFQPPSSRTDPSYLEKTIYPTFNAYLKAKLGVDLKFDEFKQLLLNALPDAKERLIFSYYEMWRSQVARESMHVGRMVAKEDLKGYVSTSKTPLVAKGFTYGNGYVYVTLVETGFHVPRKGTHPWTELFGEEEIASPFPIPWDNIIGFRAAQGPKRLFTGPLFFRRNFDSGDKEAFKTCYRALSGKHDF